MFLKRKMNNSIGSYSDKILQIKEKIGEADAVIIGAGAGFSTSAGFVYNGERFEKYFSDFRKKYGFSDMYSGGFYPYKTLEKHWGYWCRYIYINGISKKECLNDRERIYRRSTKIRNHSNQGANATTREILSIINRMESKN